MAKFKENVAPVEAGKKRKMSETSGK